MVTTRLSWLLLCIVCIIGMHAINAATSTAASSNWNGSTDNGRVVVSVNDNDGSYTITIDGQLWFVSGSTAIHVNQRWYMATKPSSSSLLYMNSSDPVYQLRLTSTNTGSGGDILGMYDWHRLSWLADSTPFETEYRVYRHTPLILFEQFWPAGAYRCLFLVECSTH
jgi:lipoprotein-anchoring transpeptidase ErfK/SrfK